MVKEREPLAGGAYKRWPVRFGDEQITAFDKVMQISNEEQVACLATGRQEDEGRETGDAPVFNGQIGIARGEWPRATQKVRGANEKGQGRGSRSSLRGSRICASTTGRRAGEASTGTSSSPTRSLCTRAKGASSATSSSSCHKKPPTSLAVS